jgi:hypothetical protein
MKKRLVPPVALIALFVATPAQAALDVVAYEGPPPMLTKVSIFTLTGC